MMLKSLSGSGKLVAASAGVFCLLITACTNIDTPAEPDDVLLLAASLSELPADGFSTTNITAQISPQAKENYRDVTFTTTLGTFRAADPDHPDRIVVTANSAGIAVAALQSSPQTGTAVVTVEIRDEEAVKVARTVRVTFEPLESSDVIQIQAESSTAPADGASVTNIFAKVAETMPLQQREILFTTTAGSFGGVVSSTATRTAGSDAVALVGLISPREVVTALVSATVNGQQSYTNVAFERALPDQATMSVFGSLQLQATFATKVSLEVELFRDVGAVTPGTEVAFRCFDDSTGNMFGFFSGVTPSDDNGMVSAQFTPGNTNERGEATIRARVAGTEVLARVKIEIVDPPP
jgi:hypothetical protein